MEILYHFERLYRGLSHAFSPSEDTVYVVSGDGNLYSADASSGQQRWKFITGAPVWTTPAVTDDGRLVFIASNNGFVYAIDASTGSQLWNTSVGSQGGSVFLHPSQTALFVTTARDLIYALNTSNGYPLWTFDAGTHNSENYKVARAVLHPSGRTLFFIASASTIYALNLSSGTLQWLYTPPSSPNGVQLSHNGHVLYVACQDGLYALDVRSTMTATWKVSGAHISTSISIFSGGISIPTFLYPHP